MPRVTVKKNPREPGYTISVDGRSVGHVNAGNILTDTGRLRVERRAAFALPSSTLAHASMPIGVTYVGFDVGW